MGGYDDNATRAVFGLVRLSNWGLGICSGTLIAPNVVLTAQHCVAPINDSAQNGGVACGISNFGTHYPAHQLYASPDSELAQWGNWYQASQVLIPPGVGDVCGEDVALLVLDKPVPADVVRPLMPRVDLIVEADEVAGTGEGYSAVGYGHTGGGNGSGVRRRRDALAASCVAQFCPFYAGVRDTEWVGEAGVCQGDSGGPALDLQGRVIGVASRGGQGCSFPVYGGVWAWSEWLKSSVVNATQSAGVATPKWALGWPTEPKYHHPVGGSCVVGDDCESGMCDEGICTRRCIPEAPCPDGFTCSATNGVCRQYSVGAVCATGAECPSGECADNVCTRRCDADSPCPGGWICTESGGLCTLLNVGGTCTTDTECAPGVCAGGQCTRACAADAPCFAPYGCDPATNLCAPIPLSAECTSDAACQGGVCLEGACTWSCAASDACPPTHACDATSQLCEPIPLGGACASDTECAPGACVDGVCSGTCAADGDCAEGYTCDQGSCQLAPVGGACDADDQCPGGQCLNGTCTRQCGLQAPCRAGYACGADGLCAALPTEPASGCQVGAPTAPLAPMAAVTLVLLGLVALRRRT